MALALLVFLTAACHERDDEPSGSSRSSASSSKVSEAERARSPLRVPQAPVEPGDDLELTTNGEFVRVTVRSVTDGSVLPGVVTKDGSTWTPTRAPKAGHRYQVEARVRRGKGGEEVRRSHFHTAAARSGSRLTLSLRPGQGDTVGVGAPVVVRFDQAIDDRAAVERVLVVRSTPTVSGSWHWVDDKQVRFRPKEYWPAGTKVRVLLPLDGVRAGKKLYGGRDYDVSFQVGEKHITRVDGDTHTMTLTADGQKVGSWPTSLGKPEFATRNGTYVVLSKERVRNMTSCGANITCDRDHAEWYDVDVDYSVRLTWSGTFVHAAPWSRDAQGQANVSHGCINLSEKNAETFNRYARYGDVVEVEGTGRDNDDLVSRADPGMVDWNQDWNDYVDGSALDSAVTTRPV